MDAKRFLLAKAQGKQYEQKRLKIFISFQEKNELMKDEPINIEEDIEVHCIYQDGEKFKNDIAQHKKETT